MSATYASEAVCISKYVGGNAYHPSPLLGLSMVGT